MGWMRQSIGELAVIGEDQQALGLGIESSDVEQAVLALKDEVPVAY